MDIAQYLPMFMAEAREHLQELNLAVVRVEETPDDRETVDEIFRIAHSLKGMSATMGFEGMASLTHHMEDVFELLKQRRGGLDRAAIDVLLECLDALEAAVDASRPTAPSTSTPPRSTTVSGPWSARPSPPPHGRRPGPRPPRSAAAAVAAGARVVHVSATLTEDTLMPSVRAYMVLAAIAEHGELVASVPHHDDVEGFDGREIEAWLACDHEDDALIATVTGVPDVAARDGGRGRSARGRGPRGRGARRGARARPGARARRRPPRSCRRAEEGRRHRPRRRRAPRRPHAQHGRARRAPHARRVARRRGRRARPEPGDAGAHALLAGPAGDGHAGPDDPGRRRLHALPAPRPRPVVQARQGRRAQARRQGHRARPHRRRRPRRPARPPHPQRARPRPRAARRTAPRRASRRPARSRSPPATPAATSSSTSATTAAASTRSRSVAARSSAGSSPPRPPRRSTPRAPRSCSSSPASRPPRSRATSPAAASAWTPCGR